MIKVIEGHKVKPDTNIQSIQGIFLKLRASAMQYPGFIGAENLVGAKDASIFVFVSTWNAVENWKAWEMSRIRTELHQQVEELLMEESKVNIYSIVPAHW